MSQKPPQNTYSGESEGFTFGTGSRRHKYGATPRNAAGLTREQAETLGLKFTRYFDSTKEARRYWELQQLEVAGEISGLEQQVRFPIAVNGVQVCVYVADARYVEDGQVVVEDTKSPATRTALYRLKAKLLFACHGIRVRET